MYFTKKPVTVEAVKWDGYNLNEIIAFVGNKVSVESADTVWEAGGYHPMTIVHIVTLEGVMIASIGD